MLTVMMSFNSIPFFVMLYFISMPNKVIYMDPKLKILEKKIYYKSNSDKVIYYSIDCSFIDNDSNFTKSSHGTDSEFCIIDNYVIVKSKFNQCILYTSTNDWEKVKQGPKSHHMLLGLNQYGDQLLNKKNEIYDELFKNLSIRNIQVHVAYENLKLIDDAIDSSFVDDEFVDKNFIGMCLYIGDLYTKKYQGHWELKYVTKDDLWIPEYLTKSGNVIPVDRVLYEYLEDYRQQKTPGLLQAVYNVGGVYDKEK
jgi:hypothetical protein